MKRFRYEVTLTYQGTFEMDEEEAADYEGDEDALQDYALDQALSGSSYDVDETVVYEVSASV